jgi:hypothetical protein
MKDQLEPAAEDQSLETLLSVYPALHGLLPFYIDWELIWPM